MRSYFPALSVPLFFLFACLIKSCKSFLHASSFRRRSFRIAGNEFDYEYLPPNADAAANFQSDLSSSYPPGTPAGLRGEAIRSAFRSGNCVGWKLDNRGVVRVEGPGTINFLNGKLTQSIQRSENFFCEASILTPKGYVVDCLGVAVVNPQLAFLITSPGYSGQELFERLNKYVFPLDEVTLSNIDQSTNMFSLASIRVSDVQKCVDELVASKLRLLSSPQLPKRNGLLHVDLPSDSGGNLLIIPSSCLHSCAGPGYSFVFVDSEYDVCSDLWNYLTSDACESGPIAAGAIEYDTLRIESGQPGYGKEMNVEGFNVSPISLHLAVDAEKGCYMGQEGVASTLKNPRGPPRTLYHVVFADENNVYDFQSEGDQTSSMSGLSATDNLTRTPQVGDNLFVLGSNEEIPVGIITSVAEPSSTGDKTTVCMALIRRADSIRRKMAARGIELPVRSLGDKGEVLPPPLDTLDDVEVIIGGTFTVGRLKMVPGRLQKRLFIDDVPGFVDDLSNDDVVLQRNQEISNPNIEKSDDILEELAKAEREAEAAADEARRKEAKMEMLRQRAEAAMARRKKNKS